jgi:glutamate dehydrogenase (NAD(P)+)
MTGRIHLSGQPQEWNSDKTISKLHFLNSSGESFLCEVLDTSNTPIGWAVVDSLVNGKSHGGLRMTQSVSAGELRELARRMTLKFGFLGLGGGGAKAGVLGDPEAPQNLRMERLRLFADGIAPLVAAGTYVPHPDVGTSGEEIAQLLRHIGIKRGPREPSREESGSYTSLTVAVAARIGAEHLGIKFVGIKTAIEGFGKVGQASAELLGRMGARIVGVSTSHGALYREEGLSIEGLVSSQRTHGSAFVRHYKQAEQLPKEELLTLPVELLCPCAVGSSIDEKNAFQIHASVISSGANCPVTNEAIQVLFQRKVLNLPDFITNSGGVLGGTMAFAGINLSDILELIEAKLVPRIRRLIETSHKLGKEMSAVAEQESITRFQRAKTKAELHSYKNTLFQVGLEFFRRGWLPPALIRQKALQYFSDCLE